MEIVSTNDGTTLHTLADAGIERDAQISSHAADESAFYSDCLQHSESPIFDSCYGTGGSETTMEMAYFIFKRV